jgi:AcrR family transcriptional regulator
LVTVFDETVVPLAPRRPTTRRQQALLAALGELFDAEGFAHFTLDDLAARMHCSKSSLYRLAPSKDQLAVVVMAWRGNVRDAQLDELLAKGDSAHERLRTYLTWSREMNLGTSQALFDDVISFKPTRDLWEQAGLRVTARLADLVTAGIEAGEFRAVSPYFVGYLVAYAADGIRRGIATRVTGIPEDEAYAALIDFVFQSLEGSGEATNGARSE